MDRLKALVRARTCSEEDPHRLTRLDDRNNRDWTGRQLSRQQSAGRCNCVARGGRRADDVSSQGLGMANRRDARSNHDGADGARIRGDAVVDAAVCVRMDFTFDLVRRVAGRLEHRFCVRLQDLILAGRS